MGSVSCQGVTAMWDRWRLDWEAALRALPFLIQRLAVVLAGLVVAVLALLGGLAILIRPVDAPPPPAPVILGGQPPATQPPGTGPSHSPTPGQPRATAPGAAPSAPATTTPGGLGRSAPPAVPPGTSTTPPSTGGGLIGGLVDRLLPPSTS
jgi:hypothetical protein